MSKEEIERRGRVVIDPCVVCAHNRQAHVVEGVFVYEVRETQFQQEIHDACVACECLEFIERDLPPSARGLSDPANDVSESPSDSVFASGGRLIRDDVAELDNDRRRQERVAPNG